MRKAKNPPKNLLSTCRENWIWILCNKIQILFSHYVDKRFFGVFLRKIRLFKNLFQKWMNYIIIMAKLQNRRIYLHKILELGFQLYSQFNFEIFWNHSNIFPFKLWCQEMYLWKSFITIMPVLLPTEIIRHGIYMIWNDFVDKYVNGDQTGVCSIKYVEVRTP